MLTASPAPRFSTTLDMAVANPKTCWPVILGGSESAFGSVISSTRDGPACAKAVAVRGFDLGGIGDAHRVETQRPGHGGVIGVRYVHTEVRQPVHQHFELDHAQR